MHNSDVLSDPVRLELCGTWFIVVPEAVDFSTTTRWGRMDITVVSMQMLLDPVNAGFDGMGAPPYMTWKASGHRRPLTGCLACATGWRQGGKSWRRPVENLRSAVEYGKDMTDKSKL